MDFENRMRDNMLKTRIFKIPDDIKEPQHRIFWWNEQCCILSAKEAASEIEKNLELLRNSAVRYLDAEDMGAKRTCDKELLSTLEKIKAK